MPKLIAVEALSWRLRSTVAPPPVHDPLRGFGADAALHAGRRYRRFPQQYGATAS